MDIEESDGKGKILRRWSVPDPEPAPPTEVERLAAVLVTKVDTLTEADVAKALGVHEDRVAAASAELTKKPAPTKGEIR